MLPTLSLIKSQLTTDGQIARVSLTQALGPSLPAVNGAQSLEDDVRTAPTAVGPPGIVAQTALARS